MLSTNGNVGSGTRRQRVCRDLGICLQRNGNFGSGTSEPLFHFEKSKHAESADEHNADNNPKIILVADKWQIGGVHSKDCRQKS